MDKQLLILGRDKICRKCTYYLDTHGIDWTRLDVVIDASTDFKRVYKLLRRGRMPLRSYAAMAWAELFRKQYPDIEAMETIRSNASLCELIQANAYQNVYLFRVGLIIGKKVLATGPRFLNLHCASIPAYGGLASIYRALRDNALDQEACLHVVTPQIDDDAEILDKESFRLDRAVSYAKNEEVAYEAGMHLLARTLPHDESVA